MTNDGCAPVNSSGHYYNDYVDGRVALYRLNLQNPIIMNYFAVIAVMIYPFTTFLISILIIV